MKKFIFILIPSLLLALLFILGYQYVTKSQTQKGALQVTSSPTSKVFLNDKYLGQTPLCKCDPADMIKTGDYTIRLVPTDKSLQEFQEKITISEAILTVVDRKFGRDFLSEGYVISLTPLSDKKKTELMVVSFPQGSTVLLDNDPIGKTPVLFKDPTESDHIVKVKKNGYNEKSVRIRNTQGYKLTLAAYLSINPDNISNTTTNPTLSPDMGKVTISDTPTGFLRVRDTSSVDGTEVGKVSPGETYPLVAEQEGWYKIKLTNGTEGWISTQFAQLNK